MNASPTMAASESGLQTSRPTSAVAPARDLPNFRAMPAVNTCARPSVVAVGEGSGFRLRSLVLGPWSLVVLLLALVSSTQAGPTNSPARGERGLSYLNDVVPEYPWSIHLVKLDRTRRDYVFGSSLGGGEAIGMSTLSEQLKTLPPAWGTPIAAVNADFYNDERGYVGDPRDLQIRNGDLISGPTGHACLWFDGEGNPHCTNVTSNFRVLFPDGASTAFGLNEARQHDGAVLYSALNGTSTRTKGGRELVLEPLAGQPWLPLRVGQTFRARVREVRETGDTPLAADSLVLSLGYKLAARTAAIAAGAELSLTTGTFPDLTGITTAIGGGPKLVHNGKPWEWSGLQFRHPRSAIGWNKDHIFLVVVDGRQSTSAGMTFPELAAYMVKLGCDEALNFDGGGSTTMWVLGQVVNSPSEGKERPGANSLVIFRRPTAEANRPKP